MNRQRNRIHRSSSRSVCGNSQVAFVISVDAIAEPWLGGVLAQPSNRSAVAVDADVHLSTRLERRPDGTSGCVGMIVLFAWQVINASTAEHESNKLGFQLRNVG